MNLNNCILFIFLLFFANSVIVHLSSYSAFSQRLKELQEEIKPLYKIVSCTYKRTSVQTIFEENGFKLDWCAFHLKTDRSDNENVPSEMVNEKEEIWDPVALFEVPQRTYIDEIAFVVAIPGVILTILVAVLSIILCLQYKKM